MVGRDAPKEWGGCETWDRAHSTGPALRDLWGNDFLKKPMVIINDLPADLISHISHLAFLEYDQLARRHEE